MVPAKLAARFWVGHPPIPVRKPLSVQIAPIAYAAVYGLGYALNG